MRGTREKASRGMPEAGGRRRGAVDLLRCRANVLTGKDKVLMRMYLENGTSFRQMARLAGVSEANIARRIRRLMKRLIEGPYVTCLRHREKFNAMELDIAKEYFLMGISIRNIAARRHWTYHRARKALINIQGLLVEIEQQAHAGHTEPKRRG